MPKRPILTINPFKNRAARYRAQALSALHANSSLSVRLKRCHAAMAKARALESQGVRYESCRATPHHFRPMRCA